MSDISVKSDASAISSLGSSVGKSIRSETSFNNKSASLKEDSTDSSPSPAIELELSEKSSPGIEIVSKLSEKSSLSGKSKELSKGRLKSSVLSKEVESGKSKESDNSDTSPRFKSESSSIPIEEKSVSNS